MSRRSLTYESRIFKYAKRNFACVVPDITRSKINPSLFDHLVKGSSGKSYAVKGLQKLLMHELSFRDFREPTCNCLRMLWGMKEEDGSDFSHENWLHWNGSRHVISNCFQGKCQHSMDGANRLPVSFREVLTHSKPGSTWYGDLSNHSVDLFGLVGPNARDDNQDFASQMRGQRESIPYSKANTDYEYILLPWKRGISMEQCHDALRMHTAKHVDAVESKEYWQEEEDGWVPETLEHVNPNAPVCWYSFDVNQFLDRIQFVVKDAGRQLLTGSFHPVDDDNWYDNVKLSVGTHERFQIVLEALDYPDDTSAQAKSDSSMVVRKAMTEIFPVPEDMGWMLRNVGSYGENAKKPPHWYRPRIVLASAATKEQVEHFKLALACATIPIYANISYTSFEITVGDHINPKVSIALAMAQPSFNVCNHCRTELLVPNRCRGCKLVSFCNKECQRKGWKKHRKVCRASKKNNK
jgi:hypothetical protein